jgi:hypothetical protein
MEHFRSTIATTAVAVLSLVAAAQILHPQDPSAESSRAGQRVGRSVERANGVAWVDPPTQATPPVSRLKERTVMVGTGALATARPASFTLVSSDMLAHPTMTNVALASELPQKAEVPRRHKLTPLATPHREAAVARMAVIERTAADQTTAAQPSSGKPANIDLIGDFLRNPGVSSGPEG